LAEQERQLAAANAEAAGLAQRLAIALDAAEAREKAAAQLRTDLAVAHAAPAPAALASLSRQQQLHPPGAAIAGSSSAGCLDGISSTPDVAHHASHSSSAQDPTDTLLQQGSSRGAGSSMQQQHQGVGKVRAPPTDNCMHKMYACETAARPAAIELKYHVCWTPVATTCVCLCVCVVHRVCCAPLVITLPPRLPYVLSCLSCHFFRLLILVVCGCATAQSNTDRLCLLGVSHAVSRTPRSTTWGRN
jgi:hypothetical protein